MKWLLVLLFISPVAKAEPAMHVGVSAGLNTALYTLCTGAMNRQVDLRLGCLGVSTFMTGMAGLLTEVNDSTIQHTPNLDTGDLTADIIGLVISGVIIYAVDIHGQEEKKVFVGYKNNMLMVGWRL